VAQPPGDPRAGQPAAAGPPAGQPAAAGSVAGSAAVPVAGRAGRLLRARGQRGQDVTSTELFFDLVYVFAITQLAHLLLGQLSLRGAAQSTLLLLAVWWAWVDTAWITNWFHPDHRAVRALLLATMLASLVMSVALPEAFGSRGLIFAAAYVTIQVGRSLFAVAVLGSQPGLRRNFQRILTWSAAAGTLWIAGGLVSGLARDWLWLAAVALDSGAPAAGFLVPGLGRSRTSDWTIEGGHLAERCQLFIMIALGESIVDIGVTASRPEIAYRPAVIAALVVAFLSSVALWWVYFDRTAVASSETIVSAADPGRIGRSAYTYFHLPMVAGIIAAAVGDELVISRPGGHARFAATAVILGGPALYLAGQTLFKRAVFGVTPKPRIAAIVVLAALVPAGDITPPLALLTAATLIVAAVAVSDSEALSATARRARKPSR
jgi:low temperature requirement protein LtrA